jgi:hypothetical protein
MSSPARPEREENEPWVRRLRSGWTVVAACAAVGLVRSLSASFPAPARSLTPAERHVLGRAAAQREPEWRIKSARGFPGDCWSADDDFHASEWSWARDEASRRGVYAADVLRAVDEDLHAFPPAAPRKSNACPCKPRPFYN